MNRDDLQRFCAGRDDLRYHLHAPWSRGEWSYATNGHIVVRVQKLADVGENPDAPNAEKLFAETKRGEFVPVPVCESPPDVDCTYCRGSGMVRNCGMPDDCCMCNGSGKTECKDGAKVGDANFQKRYLAMIQGWEIAPNGPISAAWIRNGDASGLLMPRRA